MSLKLRASPPPAHSRGRVGERLDLGVRSMDVFTTTCRGQRLGIFAGSGVGKSVLLSMLAKQATCDAVVVGLIGERGREVREFVEETGLDIAPLNRIAEASQFFRRSTDEPVNNVGGFWTATILAEHPEAKLGDDHTLVWLDPTFAISRVRHDSHAWAVAVWLRRPR